MRGIGDHTPPKDMQKIPEDNTSRYIDQQVRFYHKYGLVIHTESAREIAAQFASSGWNGIAFTEFSSTGYIQENLRDAIRRELHYWLYESDGIDGDVDDMLIAIRNLTALDGYILKCDDKE